MRHKQVANRGSNNSTIVKPQNTVLSGPAPVENGSSLKLINYCKKS